jgi:rhodanese-related sulfurtransferase
MKKCVLVILFLCGTVVAQFNQDSLKRWMKSGPSFDFILIDLRGPSDNITHVIANDLCKPYNLVWPDEFKASIPKILKDKHVVVYCRSGARSGQASSYLISEGYTNVYDAGGFMNWNDTVRAITENAIMADSLLPAPSMVPFTGTMYSWFKKKNESHQEALSLRGRISADWGISLSGRAIKNGSTAECVFIDRAGLIQVKCPR